MLNVIGPDLEEVFHASRREELGEFGPVKSAGFGDRAEPVEIFWRHGGLLDLIAIATDWVVASSGLAHVGPMAADLIHRFVGEERANSPEIKVGGDGRVEEDDILGRSKERRGLALVQPGGIEDQVVFVKEGDEGEEQARSEVWGDALNGLLEEVWGQLVVDDENAGDLKRGGLSRLQGRGVIDGRERGKGREQVEPVLRRQHDAAHLVDQRPDGLLLLRQRGEVDEARGAIGRRGRGHGEQDGWGGGGALVGIRQRLQRARLQKERSAIGLKGRQDRTQRSRVGERLGRHSIHLGGLLGISMELGRCIEGWYCRIRIRIR